jgi:UDP-2-acetamido-2,6-beta-L-arabino-hexul-4-ose reductase
MLLNIRTKMKKRIGITGQNGFIGKHLYNSLGLFPDEYERVDFERDFFINDHLLDGFVLECDIIVHLAAVNRHSNPSEIYSINIEIAEKLRSSLLRTKSKSHIIFSSSTQEERDNPYGIAKKEAREILSQWAQDEDAKFTGLIIPNVFGPFGKPYYNSVVATFCHQLSINEEPKIELDGELKLIYVTELVSEILKAVNSDGSGIIRITHTHQIKVSGILALLNSYKTDYSSSGIIPSFKNTFELNLFNTFRCYMDLKNHFPFKFKKNVDSRGAFVELIRLNVGGQVSFSITLPGITRGNHFHTRKIERFAVIKGRALIQLRRIGTSEVMDFYLDGEEPSCVDMPIWYTHNIKNIGEEELYTIFWINEFYNPEDADTFMENVS